MWEKFMIQGNQKWVKLLASVLNYYNNEVHSKIKLSPKVASQNPDTVQQNIISSNYENENTMTERQLKPKFSVVNRVRIYAFKSHFEKGFTHKHTEEVFKIHKVLKTSPTTYE
jgi:hypothetical protein